MPYDVNGFITAPRTGDVVLKIKDTRGAHRYSIFHNNISTAFIQGKNIALKQTDEDDVIYLDFATELEAKKALDRFNVAYKIIRNNYDLINNVRATTTFIHNQNSASTEWTINHDLDKFPSVRIKINTGTIDNPIYVDAIGEIVDVNNKNTIIKFNQAVIGIAYLN